MVEPRQDFQETVSRLPARAQGSRTVSLVVGVRMPFSERPSLLEKSQIPYILGTVSYGASTSKPLDFLACGTMFFTVRNQSQ